MNIAIYSAIFGRYDSPKQLPEDLPCPAFMFIDEDDLELERVARLRGWRPIRTSRFGYMSPMMRHKFWKLHPRSAFGHFDAQFDTSIWLDGSMTITASNFVDLCVEALGNDDWCMVKHPMRDCIYDEAAFSATLTWRYDGEAIRQQADYYRSIGMPEHWGLMATGANVRRHTDAVDEWCRHWWFENRHRSHQDQVSLPVMLWLANDQLKWNTNMPWFEWWHLSEHGWRG